MNYIEIKCWKPNRKRYAFIDIQEYMADRILISEKIRVKFSDGEYRKSGTEYVVVLCEFNSKDEACFIKSMERLQKNMLLTGRTDYEKVCQSLFGEIEER